jgi:hypothetical protein
MKTGESKGATGLDLYGMSSQHSQKSTTEQKESTRVNSTDRQEASILDTKNKLSDEGMMHAKTLINKEASPQEKLKAAEKLSNLGFPDLKIKDADGNIKNIHIESKEVAKGRTEVDVMTDKGQIVLRGIDDHGTFKHETNKQGKEVGFNGDKFSKENSGSALLGNEAPNKNAPKDTASRTSFNQQDTDSTKKTNPADQKPGLSSPPSEADRKAQPAPSGQDNTSQTNKVEKPGKKPVQPERKNPFAERIKFDEPASDHPRTITIELANKTDNKDAPPLTLRRMDSSDPQFYKGSDGNAYKISVNREEGTITAHKYENGKEASSKTWMKNGNELEVETKNGLEYSTLKDPTGLSIAKVVRQNDGQVYSAELAGPNGERIALKSQRESLWSSKRSLTDANGHEYKVFRPSDDGSIRYKRLETDTEPAEETTIRLDGKIIRKKID